MERGLREFKDFELRAIGVWFLGLWRLGFRVRGVGFLVYGLLLPMKAMGAGQVG